MCISAIVRILEKKSFSKIQVKIIYKMLLKKVKTPTAENTWQKIFKDLSQENLNVKYNSIDCEDFDFKMTQKNIYK